MRTFVSTRGGGGGLGFVGLRGGGGGEFAFVRLSEGGGAEQSALVPPGNSNDCHCPHLT